MIIPKNMKLLALVPLVFLTQCDAFKPKVNYGYDIELKVSPKGEAALKTSQGLFVDAWFYGEAAPQYRSEADELNRIDLGADHLDFPAGARRLHVTGEDANPSKLSHTHDGVMRVFVSVDRTGAPADGPQLKCHDFIGTLAQAQKEPVVMRCEFENETYWEDAASSSTSSQ